jgi:signal transduction histidine kinase
LHELRYLFDPLNGDYADRPDRRMQINLRRVEITAIIMIAVALIDICFGLSVGSFRLIVLFILAAISGVAFMATARYAQKNPDVSVTYLPEFFIVFALLFAQCAGRFFAEITGHITTGYAMIFLAFAVFFQTPPRRFALIGASTFAVFMLWSLSLDVSWFEKLSGSYNTALAIVGGLLGRQGLDRLQEVDRAQRLKVSAQNEELSRANQRLGDHNAELNKLMAIAAHDLRSPLLGLGNLLDLAGDRLPPSQAVMRDLLHEAGNSVTAMIRLVGRLLEAHEVEAGARAKLRQMDLRQALTTAVSHASHTAEVSQIALQVSETPEAVNALADPEMLEQILENLISNAIRFSPKGSTVELKAGLGSKPFIEIIDRGVGIPVEERDRLFSKFRRGSANPINGLRGSGLGLYIVRTLAGSITAEASYRPREGGGSVFRVEFMNS